MNNMEPWIAELLQANEQKDVFMRYTASLQADSNWSEETEREATIKFLSKALQP